MIASQFWASIQLATVFWDANHNSISQIKHLIRLPVQFWIYMENYVESLLENGSNTKHGFRIIFIYSFMYYKNLNC